MDWDVTSSFTDWTLKQIGPCWGQKVGYQMLKIPRYKCSRYQSLQWNYTSCKIISTSPGGQWLDPINTRILVVSYHLFRIVLPYNGLFNYKRNSEVNVFWFECSTPSAEDPALRGISGAAYMRQCTGSSLVQVMACRLFGAKPLPEPMLAYYQLHSGEQISAKFQSEFCTFHWRKCIWNCHLPKWWPFCPGGGGGGGGGGEGGVNPDLWCI